MSDQNAICTECGQHVGIGVVYHPYLYCELYKLGHSDQAEYLARNGFVREAGQ